ncbi:hypothetical protein [Ereboglobus luteus]|uniref:hypothetical protein n=1 Tax=Ereboglobus luteus TaxID=1796921 RepID=UPI001F469666|nr:hypothetical protein [Ereboglobus luteus]
MSKSPSNDDKSPKRRGRPAKRKPAASKAEKPTAKKAKITAPAIKKSPRKPAGASALLGIGLDNADGHKRVTTGEQFAIVGGSEQTHERMTETVIKTFEELKHRGKYLSQVERAELAEIIHKATPR